METPCRAAQPPLRAAAFCLLFTAMVLGAYLLFYLFYRDTPGTQGA